MKATLKLIVSVTVLLTVYLSSFSQQVAKSIPNSTSPDGLIGFLEFKPTDYGSQKHPLIIFLHGIGERGNGTSEVNNVAANAIPLFCSKGATMRFTVGGQTSSFVVLSPQLSKQYGYWPTFYVREMIKYAKANLQIDTNRIYITGLSLGGGGTWRSITDAWGFDYTFDVGIAAAAPVCGTQEETDGDFCKTIGANKLPVWAFHSMDDGTVGVGATQHAEILAINCGLNPAAKFTYYQYGGHSGAWINAYDTGHITTTVSGGGNFTANPNMYEWFLSNKRNGSTTPPANTAPVANAGTAQTITLPISTVTLTGTGTGTNGATISSYSWAKTSGPSAGVISVPLLNTTLITGLVQGTYVFTLTVTDNHGLTSSSNVTITVNPLLAANQPPVANAGGNATITLPASSVNLNGTASKDPDGSIVKYTWVKTSGPSTYNIVDPTVASTWLNNLGAGVYVFTLTVTDNAGATASSSLTVTVNAAASAPPANQSPVANAGSNATITMPTSSVNLVGTGSNDPDGTIAGYSWTKTSGPATYTIVNAAMGSTWVTNLVAGVYVFTLTVKDNAGATASSAVTVTVNPAASAPSVPSSPDQPIGYVKMAASAFNACNDASSSGRTAVYGSSIANGAILYIDAAHSKAFNGGWNWYSITPTLGGTVTQSFAIYPNGSINQIYSCATGQPVTTPPVTTPPVTTPPVTTPPVTTPPSSGNLLGYIKVSVSAFNACNDPSTSGRIAVYGSGIANGGILYTDAAMTQVVNGGWNWYSFETTLGGTVSQTFALYPTGAIFYLRSCAAGFRVADMPSTTPDQEEAALKILRDSAAAAAIVAKTGKLMSIYPNPVSTNATIELYSAGNGLKTIAVYDSKGVLKSKYTVQAVQGKNVFSLKDAASLVNGLYIVEIGDNNGKQIGTLKFIKIK